MMKRIFFVIVALAAIFTSCQNSKVNINGRFVGSDAEMVYLEQTTTLEQKLIDSVKLAEDGSFAMKIEEVAATPSLYTIIYNGERVPLLLSAGEKVSINAAGNILRNYTIEGSLESELLHSFNKEYVEGVIKLNEILSKYTSQDLSKEEQTSLAKQYTQLRNEIKRAQLRFIVEHKENIAAVYALYQRLPEEQYLVNSESDLIYFRTVADAVCKSYPTSPFVVTLRNDVARMEAQASLLNTIEERDFPDIIADDMYGNSAKLSELEGNVILVDFWAAELGNSNALNADLKQIYNKYEDKGFRVYQVSFDTSKATWIKAVQEQKLPWVSVCDFRGQASPIMGVYNVRSLPSNYLIDRNGHIVAKNVYSDALERELKKIL
jgi:peroxiredoxin